MSAALHTEPQSAQSHYLGLDEDIEPRRSALGSVLALGTFTGLTAAVAVAGARSTMQSAEHWYDGLDKPSFTPPKEVFGPVWSGLYVLIALSGWRVWKAPPSRRRTLSLALWVAQLALNAAWSPLFFGLRRPRTALVDLAGLGLAATAYTLAARKVDRGAAWMMVPYLGWIGFAGALNEEIVRLND